MEDTPDRISAAPISHPKLRNRVCSALCLLVAAWFVRGIFAHSSYAKAAAANLANITFSSLIHYNTSVSDTLDLTSGNSSANISTSIKVAVIIETRRSGNIIPLILHFSAVLGPTWPVLIYTPAENFGSFSTSAALLRHQQSGRIVVRPLEGGVWFPNWDSVSSFLTSSWLWENLAPAEHILVFQSDSMLCSNAVRSVDEFFEWDFIGAPIDPKWGVGYNGGLSLRRRSTVLKILEEFEYKSKLRPRAEDQWFFRRYDEAGDYEDRKVTSTDDTRMKEVELREAEDGIEDGIKLPSMEIARTFAVESIDYPHPLGLHQPTRFLREHMLSLDEWCPEYKLATQERISGRLK